MRQEPPGRAGTHEAGDGVSRSFPHHGVYGTDALRCHGNWQLPCPLAQEVDTGACKQVQGCLCLLSVPGYQAFLMLCPVSDTHSPVP